MRAKEVAEAKIDAVDEIKTWLHAEIRLAELACRNREGVPESVDYHQGRINAFRKILQGCTSTQRDLAIPAGRVWYEFTDER